MERNLIDLNLAKKFCRIDSIDTDSDDVLKMLISAAIQMVEARLKRPLVGGENAVLKEGEPLPEGIAWVIYGIVAFMYENRDATDDDIRARLLRNCALDPYIDWRA